MGADKTARVLRVALPVPLLQTFDYAVGAGDSVDEHWIGCRVGVRFGARRLVGVVVAVGEPSGVHALRTIESRLDAQPILGGELLESVEWAARYYGHPLGEVLATALPAWLRTRAASPARASQELRLSAAGRVHFQGVRPRLDSAAERLLERVESGPSSVRDALVDAASKRVARDWRRRGWLETGAASRADGNPTPGPALNAAQQAAVDSVRACAGFAVSVLDGVTGSGKTEVYLALIRAQLDLGSQSLVLVPEIGLTPQLLVRLESRLGVPIGVIHSGLSASARTAVWKDAASGELKVILGTRSAVFVPLPRAGLIVVDEEHDTAFKQQDGFRYHARDLAIVRAQALGIPVVLGSATPSIETLANVAEGRYRRLVLPQRAGVAQPPSVRVLDLRGATLHEGMLGETRAAIAACLARGEQALVFRNQRGFAPVLLCHDCGWYPACPRCSTSDAEPRALTLHLAARHLRCHHCGFRIALPQHCESCAGLGLTPAGFGTQRIEATLSEAFPDARVVRIDADTTQRQDGLAALLAPLGDGAPALLVGTQMLAKGHDLPHLTLAVVLGVDAALAAADFRAPERFAQLLVQVSGRVGRGALPGRVLVQTHQPRHPLLVRILSGGYGVFAAAELEQRRAARLPPFVAQALLRAEAKSSRPVDAFLDDAVAALGHATDPDSNLPVRDTTSVRVHGPLPAPQPRRAGFVRAQVMLEADRRAVLQAHLPRFVAALHALPSARRVRWSLDVDPVDWT